MIRDLSETLKEILTKSQGLPGELKAANIVFDRPVDGGFPQNLGTVVDLFLYDVREDVDLRSNEPEFIRNNGQVTILAPPMRVACSYLVTAWPVGGTELALQEHRLLSQVLQLFSSLPTIPANFLQGSLVGQEPPLPMVTALVDPQKNLSEFWMALGVNLHPSITLKVTLSMDVLKPVTASKVITKTLRTGERTSPDDEQLIPATAETITRIGIGGSVTDENQSPIDGAEVSLPDLGLETVTDAVGRYKFTLKQPGILTLQVRKGDKLQTVSINAAAGTETQVQLT
jgi:hypothetical protein